MKSRRVSELEVGEGTRKRYVVEHNLLTEVYLMTVMETTTCFDLYWPSSGCLCICARVV